MCIVSAAANGVAEITAKPKPQYRHMAPREDLTSLPRKGVWQCYVHKLRAWVAGDGGLPVRPYLMLVVSTEVGGGGRGRERTGRVLH